MDHRLRVRRARRDDLVRVRALLGAHGAPAARDRKRWRRLVSTLREDLYLAEREHDETLVGLALIVYVRGLGPPAAIVRHLHGAAPATDALLACARTRALARGCACLEVQVDDATASALLAAGWNAGPRTVVRPLSA